MPPRLSVIVITRNEADNIAGCLASVDFADEKIVVDRASTDDTVAIARQAGAHVAARGDWIGFGPQKNRALDLATAEWVLSVDADERVTPKLSAQIREAMSDDRFDAYTLRIETAFYGLRVRHSEFYANTSSVRLFRRTKGRFRPVLVHETVELLSSRVGALSEPLEHLSFVDPDAYLRKVNQYAALQAQMLYDLGRRSGLLKAFLHGFAAFSKSYVVRLGFLDGGAGIAIAVLSFELTYHKYFKLALLSRGSTTTRGWLGGGRA